MISKCTNRLLPENFEGKPVNIEKTVQRSSSEEALDTYNTAKAILLRPFLWQRLPGFEGAKFELEKAHRADEIGVMQKGDFIKIDIPGPGPHSGGGFDWVTVGLVEENFDPEAENSFGIMVKPCPDPASKETTIVAHFFKEKATSTFILKHIQKTVTAYYYERNEVPNIKGASLFDKLRNAFVSLGALAGISNLQWKLLINGLLKDDVNN